MRLQIRQLQQEVRELRQKEQARLRECDALQKKLARLQAGTAAAKAEVSLPQVQVCGAVSGVPSTQPEVVHSTAPYKSDHRYDAIGRVVVEDGVVRMQPEDEVAVASPTSVDSLLDMDDKALEASGLTAQVP